MSESEVKATPNLQVLEKVEEIKGPPGELGATLELIVKNKKGEVTKRKVMLSESFVQGFLKALYLHAGFIAYGYRYYEGLTNVDVSDYERQLSVGNNTFYCLCPVNQDGYGIQVGTGATAPTVTDTKMETKITHGVGAGQMQYSAVTFGAPSSDGSISHFTVTRDFSNNSGGSITVREIGLVGTIQTDAGSTTYHLMIRDAVNIAVPDGETLTVNYRIQATA